MSDSASGVLRLCAAVAASCGEIGAAVESHDGEVAQAGDDEEALAAAYQRKVGAMVAVARDQGQALREGAAQLQSLLDDAAADLAEFDTAAPELHAHVRQLKGEREEALELAEAQAARLLQAQREAQEADARARRVQSALAQLPIPPSFTVAPDAPAAHARFVEARRALRTAAERRSTQLRRYFALATVRTEGAVAADRDGSDAAADTRPLRALRADVVAQLATEVAEWLKEADDEAPTGLEHLLRQVIAARSRLQQCGWPEPFCDVSEEAAFCGDVRQATQQWQRTVAAEVERRAARQQSLAQFNEDRDELLRWCRLQRNILQELKQAEHVQDFCTSIVDSLARMEDNLQLLCDAGQVLLPEPEVEASLAEVNEVWLSLQLYAFEVKQRMMLEVHPQTRLEDEVRRFADFSGRLGRFLSGGVTSVESTLSQCSKEDPRKLEVDEILALSQALKADLASFQHLPEGLQGAADTVESVRDAYSCFRRHVCGKLTFLSDGDPRWGGLGCCSGQRRRDVGENAEDLKGWIRHHARGAQWAEVWSAVQNIQSICETELTRGDGTRGGTVPRFEVTPHSFAEGNRVVVRCPAGLYPPEHTSGTVQGHARGRVGVILDTGRAVGVDPRDLTEEAEDEDGCGAWEVVFPVGCRVELVTEHHSGSPLHALTGAVTGCARGRVGVRLDGGGVHGFSEQQLRPALSDERAVEAYYPTGATVRVRDTSDVRHGDEAEVVELHQAGGGVSVLVRFADGSEAALSAAQVVRERCDADDENPDLASRWPTGARVEVSDVPKGGEHSGKLGTVTGHSRGRVGVDLDDGSGAVGVAPRSLRHHDEDDDEDGAWAKTIFPPGTRVLCRSTCYDELDGKEGVVVHVNKSAAAGVTVEFDGGSRVSALPAELLTLKIEDDQF